MSDTRAYFRATSNVSGEVLSKKEEEEMHDELDQAVEEIEEYGTNGHYFTTHHVLMLQEEIVLAEFGKS